MKNPLRGGYKGSRCKRDPWQDRDAENDKLKRVVAATRRNEARSRLNIPGDGASGLLERHYRQQAF